MRCGAEQLTDMRRDIQQCGAKTYSAVQGSVVKCSTAWCETVPFYVEACTAVQEMWCDAVQHGGGGGNQNLVTLITNTTRDWRFLWRSVSSVWSSGM